MESVAEIDRGDILHWHVWLHQCWVTSVNINWNMSDARDVAVWRLWHSRWDAFVRNKVIRWSEWIISSKALHEDAGWITNSRWDDELACARQDKLFIFLCCHSSLCASEAFPLNQSWGYFRTSSPISSANRITLRVFSGRQSPSKSAVDMLLTSCETDRLAGKDSTSTVRYPLGELGGQTTDMSRAAVWLWEQVKPNMRALRVASTSVFSLFLLLIATGLKFMLIVFDDDDWEEEEEEDKEEEEEEEWRWLCLKSRMRITWRIAKKMFHFSIRIKTVLNFYCRFDSSCEREALLPTNSNRTRVVVLGTSQLSLGQSRMVVVICDVWLQNEKTKVGQRNDHVQDYMINLP